MPLRRSSGAPFEDRRGAEHVDLAQRLRCYEVHIGLGAQAYNAFKGRWAELAACAAHTLAIARQSG